MVRTWFFDTQRWPFACAYMIGWRSQWVWSTISNRVPVPQQLQWPCRPMTCLGAEAEVGCTVSCTLHRNNTMGLRPETRPVSLCTSWCCCCIPQGPFRAYYPQYTPRGRCTSLSNPCTCIWSSRTGILSENLMREEQRWTSTLELRLHNLVMNEWNRFMMLRERTVSRIQDHPALHKGTEQNLFSHTFIEIWCVGGKELCCAGTARLCGHVVAHHGWQVADHVDDVLIEDLANELLAITCKVGRITKGSSVGMCAIEGILAPAIACTHCMQECNNSEIN